MVSVGVVVGRKVASVSEDAMKWVARVSFQPKPQYEGDSIMCDATRDGMLPRVIRELVAWGLRVKMVKNWERV
jgi:hypothetical protein